MSLVRFALDVQSPACRTLSVGQKMNVRKSHPGVALVVACSSFLVPLAVWLARCRIIEMLAPDDPLPQAAMAVAGLIFIGSLIVFGCVGIFFLIVALQGLRRRPVGGSTDK